MIYCADASEAKRKFTTKSRVFEDTNGMVGDVRVWMRTWPSRTENGWQAPTDGVEG